MKIWVVSEIPFKRNLALQFCRNRNKDVIILTETHFNLGEIHHIRSNWLGAIFFSTGDSYTKGLLVLLHLDLEAVAEVDTDTKGRFVSLPSNDRVVCVWG